MSRLDSPSREDRSVRYAPPGMYFWDFWLFREDDTYYLYHLQAPRVGDEGTRHFNASVGHATSTDLVEWSHEGTALVSGDGDAWDDAGTWTGCTVSDGDRYYLFYTGRRGRETVPGGFPGHTQRIGVAVSDDLRNWEKHDANPVLEHDGEWYADHTETFDGTTPWRDPEVVYDEDSGYWYAFVTARDRRKPAGERGCIARARSTDLVDWEVLPPACSLGNYAKMEVPDLHYHDGRWYLLFSVKRDEYAEDNPRERETGVRYLVGDSLSGAFREPTDNLLMGDDVPGFTGRWVETPGGDTGFATWTAGPEEGYDTDHPYTFARPWRVEWTDDGPELGERL
ncbi:family 43 glycosylhydrolase [Halospeciosus flavus]|uniref:beta-fructofuranosidase n=2 Tax=Halospeciosus flavus TaxID=3032283 RepID=A0ABD5Z972_9EURY|nr:family 43 glycosylhydrolase [Halospeciosus flavus]